MFNLGERTVGEEFRGAIQTNARHYLAEVDAVAVGYIGYVGYGISDRLPPCGSSCDATPSAG